MTIQQALKHYKDNKTINIYTLADELHISYSTLYRYMNGSRKLNGLDSFGLAMYLHLKHNIETDELEEYKHLLT